MFIILSRPFIHTILVLYHWHLQTTTLNLASQQHNLFHIHILFSTWAGGPSQAQAQAQTPQQNSSTNSQPLFQVQHRPYKNQTMHPHRQYHTYILPPTIPTSTPPTHTSPHPLFLPILSRPRQPTAQTMPHNNSRSSTLHYPVPCPAVPPLIAPSIAHHSAATSTIYTATGNSEAAPTTGATFGSVCAQKIVGAARKSRSAWCRIGIGRRKWCSRVGLIAKISGVRGSQEKRLEGHLVGLLMRYKSSDMNMGLCTTYCKTGC